MDYSDATDDIDFETFAQCVADRVGELEECKRRYDWELEMAMGNDV